ncbi:unnamed protein product [Calypogeia fissa]
MDSRNVLLLRPTTGVATSTSCSSRSFRVRRVGVTPCSVLGEKKGLINVYAKPSSRNCRSGSYGVFVSSNYHLGSEQGGRKIGNSASGFGFGSSFGDGRLGRSRFEKNDRSPKRSSGGGEGRVATGAAVSSDQRAVAAEEFSVWLKGQGFPEQAVTLKMFGEEGLGLAASRPLQAGEFALSVPENYCVTAFDVNSHPVISNAASGRGDLIGLTLWLMYEKAQGKASSWYPFLRLFPEATMSPLVWTDAEIDEQLMGSSVLEEAKQRIAALEEEHEELKASYFEKDPQAFSAEAFSLSAFKNAFTVIMSRAFYLPSADIFALIPYGDCINHRGEVGAYLDFSAVDQAVVLNVDRNYKEGQQVFVNYGQDRPNSDLLISYGFVDQANSNNCIETQVELLPADRLKVLKQQILEQAGFDSPQLFPLFEDRFPTQLLTYMRLSRLTDVGLFAKIAFDRDVIIDQSNEYEILMLLMGDCRVRLQGYSGNSDDETRIANDKNCSPKEKVAAQLRLSEKKILINTMAALRNRLAPIRGIPVKGGGLKDPNADLLEMFDIAEQVASAPAKFLANIFKK